MNVLDVDYLGSFERQGDGRANEIKGEDRRVS